MSQKPQKTAPKTISEIIADAKQKERDRLLNPRNLGRADYLSSAVLTERMVEGIIGASAGSAATLTIARMALSEASRGRREAAALRFNTVKICAFTGVICFLLGAALERAFFH